MNKFRLASPILAGLFALAAIAAGSASTPPVLRIGALFPLHGALSSLAQDEYRGVLIAKQLVNSEGGVKGRQIELQTEELDTTDQVPAKVAQLHDEKVPIVLGTYSSALSIPASQATAKLGMDYWEAGAVADRLTGQGLPNVFRVGANGTNLGTNSGRFAAEQLAPRLGKPKTQTRVSIVFANDAYGQSVAGAAASSAQSERLPVISQTAYNPYEPDWPAVLKTVRTANPDVLILASYIPDGVQFRKAMLAANLHVGAMIGSTMAECGPEFGALLGPGAVGIFASDRPTNGFNPGALTSQTQELYRQFQALWKQQMGRDVTEESLAGFSAAWALFHNVLPSVQGQLTPANIALAARHTVLPEGTLPNGAGLLFSNSANNFGQNLRASAVIWQWQRIDHSVTVWPPAYATGQVNMVPLPW